MFDPPGAAARAGSSRGQDELIAGSRLSHAGDIGCVAPITASPYPAPGPGSWPP
jgi:hypothetical protein